MKKRKDINIEIGNNIRLIRENSNLTQEQFGELVSLGAKNISDIERGITGITVGTLKRICETTCVSSDFILFGDKDINNIEHIIKQLERLPKDELTIIQDLLNKLFSTFSKLR